MEAEDILFNIFGSNLKIDDAETSTSSESNENNASYARKLYCLSLANKYIKETLAEQQSESESAEDNRPGRIGPRLVRFDIATPQGLFVVSPDRLSVNSRSNFSTIRANTGFYQGKWMYELQLGSKGVMQVGWGTAHCKFSEELGVGDTVNSYAYDGNRVRRWNVSTHKYGEPWLSGDIIGCALDMDNGTMDFYRNGRPLGRAFERITMGPGMAYFPTVSLAFAENLIANFGSTPLRYPVPGYQTLQEPPSEQVNKAELLFGWLSKLLGFMGKVSAVELAADKIMTTQAFLMCIARTVLADLGPLLATPYVAQAVFVPFVEELAGVGDSSGNKAEADTSRPVLCLDLLWALVEEHDMKACLESTVLYLLSSFRHVSLLLEYPDQCKSLSVLTSLCHHTATRQYLLTSILFDRVRFANFVHVKPLDEGGLANVVADVWWETLPIDRTVEVHKKSYVNACETIKAAISEVEALQVELLVTLLNNTDGTSYTPTSRTIFLRKFRRFVQENLISSRTPSPITLCCFHRLLVAFRILWDREIGTSPVYVPCRTFYDASINYSGIDRLGGVLSHLNKTFKAELIHLLGPEHEVIVSMERAQEPPNTFMGGPARLVDMPVIIPTVTQMISTNPTGIAVPRVLERLGYISYAREDRSPLKPGPAEPTISLLELLDGIILFYHAAAKKQIAKVANLRDSMSEYVKAITDAKSRLEVVKQYKDATSQLVQKELVRTIGVFDAKLSEQARHMAWVRAAVYSKEKQEQLAWLLKAVTLTLKAASEEGNMFSFVPDFYLEAMTDLSVGIRSHVHPTAPIQDIADYREMLKEIAEFLCEQFLDPRIVLANSKDTLILTLAGFVSNPLTLAALESVPVESRTKMVSSLLKPYENRAWAQSNWVLVRFWQGNGFAFRYEKSPHLAKKVGPKMLQQESISQPIKPCPSAIYQQHVRQALLSNPQGTIQFLNSLLNQLNWAFSEFIGMLQEIQNASSRPERVSIEWRQLKICVTCFDLAIFLLRVLEMIASVAKSIFNDPSQPSSDNLLARLCQLLCQILNRVSSHTGCFQHVVLLEIPDLDAIDHFPILTAVIGILLALLEDDVHAFKKGELKEMPSVTKTLLTEPSFQINSLSFVLGDVKRNSRMKNVKPFSLLNYKQDVTEGEINKVREMIKYLDFYRTMLPDPKLTNDDDDENSCTICYARPIATTFKPCNHQSCRTCIDRHLLNSRECFFCKAVIERVVDLQGELLHDFISDPLEEDLYDTSNN